MATVTPADEQRAALLSEPDGLYEVVDGCVVEKSMGAYEVWLAKVLYDLLHPYVKDTSSGRVVQEMIFDLRPKVDRERRPDVAFVSFERWARNRSIPRTPSWAVVPDLAVEIVSAGNTADEVAEKPEEYFQVGVRTVWVVYPRQFKVYAYRSPTDVRVLAGDDVLASDDVLPGFRLEARNVFEAAEG